MKNKKRGVPKGKGSELRRLVNLVNLEKRSVVVGAKVELCVKKAIHYMLKPGQTPSDWIRNLIIKRLKEEALFD